MAEGVAGTAETTTAGNIATTDTPGVLAAGSATDRVVDQPKVMVFDLDGVIRNFDSLEVDAVIEAELGLPRGTLWHLTMESEEIKRAVTGGLSRIEWEDLIEAELRHRATTSADVGLSFQRWRDNIGKIDASTIEMIKDWQAAGIPVFIFTNGTDRIPQELEKLEIAEFFCGVLNSFNYGVRKPQPEAYLQAHREMGSILGRTIAPESVFFTDDKEANVLAAREFGWQAEVFTGAAHSFGLRCE